MDKFKFGLFDIFVYLLPGVIILISVWLGFEGEVTRNLRETLLSFMSQMGELSFNGSLAILLFAYFFGFALHLLGYKYFNLLGKKIWKKSLVGSEGGLSVLENEHVLVRHFSEKNYHYVELWTVYRAMSFNLSLATLILALIIIVKLLSYSTAQLDWILFALVLFSMSFIRKYFLLIEALKPIFY